MKKNIIIHGLMAGIVISMLMLYNVNSASYREGNFDFDRSLMIGCASMLIGLSFIYAGIRKYRDKYREGIITFGRAFKTGSIMVLIASTIYVAAWLVDYFYFIPDFQEKYSAHILDGLRATGASPVEIDKQAKEMALFAAMYKNPFFNAMMTYVKILPVGLVITLISSFILKRKNRKFVHSIVTYKVASTFSQILEGWFTVYKQYLSVSFISANKVSLFTFSHYIGNRSALILGRDRGKTVCTISAVLDGEKGLPLDVYFKKDLDKLRSEGRKLIEVGLFADTRKLDNNITHLVELMSCASRFGIFTHHHDMVIGIDPRRMKFFATVFNCKRLSEITQYSALNGASVVLMHACGMDDETNILPAWQNIYKDDAGLNFSNRYLFNRHNFIPYLDFKLSSENFIRMVNNIPLKIDVKIPFRLYQTKSKKPDKII